MAREKNVFHKYLEEGEVIHVIVHKHWFAIFSSILKTSVWGVFLPAVIYYYFSWFLIAMILWIAYAGIRFLYVFFDWYMDAWLITDKSIVDVHWNGIFKHSSERLAYGSIEGATYEYNGIFQTLFNYGTIELQQAGGSAKLEDIVDPKDVSALILYYQAEFKDGQSLQDETQLRDVLSAMIHRHIKTNGLKVNMEHVSRELALDLDAENVIDLNHMLEQHPKKPK